MDTEYSAATAGNLFQLFVCLALIGMLAAFFSVFQVRYVPSSHGSAMAVAPRYSATPLQQIFRGLVRIPDFGFGTPSAPPASDVSPDEDKLPPAALIDRWDPFIKEASQRYSIPELWIRTIIHIESGGRTMLLGRPITSGAGAMGVMQLMGQTYQEMSTRNGLGSDPYNVHDNILAGTAYLRELYNRYGYPHLFAAYNAGPGVLEAHLLHGRRLPEETQKYLRMAMNGTSDAAPAKADAVDLGAAKAAAAKKTANAKHAPSAPAKTAHAAHAPVPAHVTHSAGRTRVAAVYAS